MKRINFIQLFVAFAILFFSACANNPKQDAKNDNKEHQENVTNNHKDCDDVHWSHHSGEHGPENWKNLCDEFSQCGGQVQSPIDIVTGNIIESEELQPVELMYETSEVDIINNGHTVQFNVSGGSSVMLDNKKYDLLQFHFHAKSEHTIDGSQYPIEVHFVHKHSDTDFAVIGIMYIEGDENKLLAEYLDNFPADEGSYEGDGTLELSELMPSELSYYNYNGSLTTPPCSEVVNWYVLKTPLEASKEQIEKFSEILDNNFRPVMPLNERNIQSYSD